MRTRRFNQILKATEKLKEYILLNIKRFIYPECCPTACLGNLFIIKSYKYNEWEIICPKCDSHCKYKDNEKIINLVQNPKFYYALSAPLQHPEPIYVEKIEKYFNNVSILKQEPQWESIQGQNNLELMFKYSNEEYDNLDLSIGDFIFDMISDNERELHGEDEDEDEEFSSDKYKNHLLTLKDRPFEEEVEGIFFALGFETELTKENHDEGIDIKMKKSADDHFGGINHYVVQCKGYSQENKIGSPEVRDFGGAIDAYN